MDTNNNENLEKEVTPVENTNTEVTKEEVKVQNVTNNVETKPVEKPKKKGSTLAVIICLIGVICLAIGVVLTVTGDNNEDTPVNENKTETNNNSNNDNNNNNGNNTSTITAENIKNYVEYNNFQMKNTMKIVSDDMTLEMIEDGKYDTLSNVYYAEISALGMVSYAYYDINNQMVYSSEDKTEWMKETDDSISLPTYPGNVIALVKANEGVTDLGNGSFSLNVDASILPDMDGMTGSVPTTVTFDANGYLTKVVFDMTGMYSEEDGVSEYTAVLEFSNINSVGTVSIPEDVLTGAVESEW